MYFNIHNLVTPLCTCAACESSPVYANSELYGMRPVRGPVAVRVISFLDLRRPPLRRRENLISNFSRPRKSGPNLRAVAS